MEMEMVGINGGEVRASEVTGTESYLEEYGTLGVRELVYLYSVRQSMLKLAFLFALLGQVRNESQSNQNNNNNNNNNDHYAVLLKF